MSLAEPSRLLPAASAMLLEPKRLTRSPPAPSTLLLDEKAIEFGA